MIEAYLIKTTTNTYIRIVESMVTDWIEILQTAQNTDISLVQLDRMGSDIIELVAALRQEEMDITKFHLTLVFKSDDELTVPLYNLYHKQISNSLVQFAGLANNSQPKLRPRHKRKTRINRYTIDGIYITTYSDIDSASQAVGLATKTLYKALAEGTISFGSRWEWAEGDFI